MNGAGADEVAAGVIHSERLDLVPMSAAFMRASLERNAIEAERVLHATLPPGWPENVWLMTMRLRQLEADFTLQQWLLRAMILRSERVMVGHIGFHTAPNPEYLQPLAPGGIEFGFQVFPVYRRRGYAREASLAMMHWAHQAHGINRFVVSIRPNNEASQALAKGLGFARIGSHIDEIDGLEEILERKIRAEKLD